ncbi:transglutaminase-like cysteine peptidase [Paraburkholderia aspalathi]|nr:transglutaminase-like cysteine peptidase [Paraburkholderia aspalathi]
MAGAFLLAFGAGVPAQAGQWSQAGGLTTIPYGHKDYCDRNPGDCKPHKVLPPLKMSAALWKRLQNVNLSVNRAIKPKSDMEIYGKRDFWTTPAKGVGDCEDYVLLKRAKLLAAGISPSQLLITMVQGSEAHVVLTVRTGEGDYILDNLRNEILPVEKTSYRYIKIQAAHHAGLWVTITGRSVNVAAK